MARKLTHINRPMTEVERQQAADIRAAAHKDFSPKLPTGQAPPGIPERIYHARKGRGLTRYELGQLAGVPSVVIRNVRKETTYRFRNFAPLPRCSD